MNKIFNNDCLEGMKKLQSEQIDFIMTSPPYANKRGAHKSPDYIKWFLPISQQLFRILNSNGSFILNIKENVTNGQRDTYVIELILALQKQGWLWTEEYIWHKTNAFPGKWPNRFRDAWERCLHFTKSKKFNMYQEEVMVPVGDWAKSRLKNISKNDRKRNESKTNSGMGRNVSNWVGRDMIFPSNVLYFAAECGNKNHHSVFPIKLPTWFIKLFSKEGDLVLDPFMGSGTTAHACQKLNRNFMGFEINKEYFDLVNKSINTQQEVLF